MNPENSLKEIRNSYTILKLNFEWEVMTSGPGQITSQDKDSEDSTLDLILPGLLTNGQERLTAQYRQCPSASSVTKHPA